MPGKVKGVVLAGVHCWRKSTFERVTPAPLVPIAGRPLIGYPLSWLRDGGVTRVSVCANSDTEAIRCSLGDGAIEGLEVDYYEDHMPRGPAGCVRDAGIESDSETFVVVDATIIPHRIDLRGLLRQHAETDAAITVVASPVDGATSPDGSDMAPVGAYIFAARVLQHIPPEGYQDIKESLIPRLHAEGERVVRHRITGSVPRVTGANSCLPATAWVLEQALHDTRLPRGYRRVDEALIHETARVGSSVQFFGPVTVGPRSHIEEGATIVGPATIGADCLIGRNALICRSNIWDGARAGAGSSLDRCILTYGADVAGGATRASTVCC